MKKFIILDSNVAIGLLKDDGKVIHMIQSLRNEGYGFCFSVISLCELISGAKSTHELQALNRINRNRFIDVNFDIAVLAGEIRREQKTKQNRVIKTPDSLIVATAIHKKFGLFTFDKGMRFASEYGVHLVE